jgi:hypothetical protein
MLTPCCPKAGPTGGAGVALAAGICNLIYPSTFFAILAPPNNSRKNLKQTISFFKIFCVLWLSGWKSLPRGFNPQNSL